MHIDIFDTSGGNVLNKKYKSQNDFEKVIDVRNLSSGIYILKVKQGKAFKTEKLIIN